MRRISLALLVALLGLSAAAAVACGGSGKDSKGDSATPGSGTPGTGPTIPLVTPARTLTPGPDTFTAVARADNPEWDQYTDKDGRYTVDVPHGWMQETTPNSFSATLPNLALVGIYCMPGTTVDSMITQDQGLFQRLGLGNMTLDRAYATPVAGATAKAVPWSADFQGVNLQRLYYYFEAGPCAWRLSLTTYPQANQAAMQAVLDHMAQTFKLKS